MFIRLATELLSLSSSWSIEIYDFEMFMLLSFGACRNSGSKSKLDWKQCDQEPMPNTNF